MSRDSSLLFSLRELKQIEDDRVRDERVADAERRRREEEARRLAAEETRRRAEEAAQLAAEEARRQDEESTARRREVALEARLRAAEIGLREAERATEEAVRREVLAREGAPGDGALGRRSWGVKVILAALAVAVIAEGVWIWRGESRGAVVALNATCDREAAPPTSTLTATPTPTPTPTATPTAEPTAEPTVKTPGGKGGRGTHPPPPIRIVDPPPPPDKPLCVCDDPRDPLCCI